MVEAQQPAGDLLVTRVPPDGHPRQCPGYVWCGPQRVLEGVENCGEGRRAQVQRMNECQASVDRRANARVDLGGEQVDMLLTPGVIFGRSQVSWKFWWCLCDGEHDRMESQGGMMGDGAFSFFFFLLLFYPLL